MKTIIFLKILLLHTVLVLGQVTLQAENLNISGPYAGPINSPFNGVAFYGNSDLVTGTVNLPTIPGRYAVDIRGASSDTSEAKINLEVGSSNVGTFGFSGSSGSISSKEITINDTNPVMVKLELQTDNGSNDTFIDQITFTYLGAPAPPRQAPVIPSVPSFESGIYRNMFVESGKSVSEVQQKVDAIWNQYFVNGDINNERLYYEVGSNMAYILDTGNNDIRSEGMSYGMMICVQLGKKTQFDKLWRFAKQYSQHPIGTDRQGLFSWQLNRTNFSMIDQNSAPDGEEYFVTALFFADAIWGSNGEINYRAEADYILDNMINKPEPSTGACPTGLVDKNEKQIVFGICGNSASFTDPSYHLPAFYEIWAREAANNNQLWRDMATTSRTYLLPRAAHPITGLMPDYSEFDGRPVNQGNHGNFEFDAWRNIMNMGFDFAWFQKNTNSIQPLINKQIDFFKDKPGYSSLWTLDGTSSRNSDHSPGLVACNAVGALALADAKVWPFVDELFDTPIPSGQYRYYDGLLYMMSFMHLAGQFKALSQGGVTPPDNCNGTPFPSATVTVNNETLQGENDGSIVFTFSDVSGRSAIEFSNDGGSTFPLNVADDSGSATFSSLSPGSYDVWVRWGDNSCPIDLGIVTVQEGSVVPNPTEQTAYVTHQIPGTIQVENYDNGGQGIAYNDTNTNNNGGQGRTDQGVDIQNTTDNGGGTNVGWIANGEWLEYTIGNVNSGNYDIEIRVAANNGNTKGVNVLLDNQNLGSVSIGNTGGWQSWTTLSINNVDVSGGANKVLRLNFSGGSFNVNWIRFSENTTNPPSGNDNYAFRARGTSGLEQVQLTVNGTLVQTFALTNAFQTYTASSSANGNARIEFINDAGGRDVEIDYLDKNGTRFQSENQSNNTGVWQNSSCGGTNSEMLHCNGYIEYSGTFNARVNSSLKHTKGTFKMFPNPSTGEVNIILPSISKLERLRLYDLSGRTIKKITKFDNNTILLTGIAKGMYIVEVVTSNETMLSKLIVQ
ncbi:glycosyl hydrolase family 8 [Aquimarina sp. D1M17]|uniref:glycosyl hydrolase family 8 n=1 Tax=Aquimarina acroporae TaxID=2937283 RepID=UPI0020BF5467|nr:glycosyl hydrolase family 8 [Aquimarina acroporae]MCK8521757.1 glycosyl hydrolase family 8 [Aquimarina acroporae]